jgi:hypothetical protein
LKNWGVPSLQRQRKCRPAPTYLVGSSVFRSLSQGRTTAERSDLADTESSDQAFKMDRHTPPSPAPAKSEPLPQGFQALVQHNSSAPPYSQEETTMEHPQTQSHPPSRYGTPVQQTYHPPRTYDQAFQFQQRGGGGPHVSRAAVSTTRLCQLTDLSAGIPSVHVFTGP